MKTSIITLLSDFGLRDHYVAEMKAVILGICPQARIVDISHLVEKFNIRMGAFLLASATRYFPKGTIHVAVVDPGVGTKRRPLLVKTKDAFYIGPDNGLLILAAQKNRIQRVYEITNAELMLPSVSRTFHGRDVFAPVAAHLANGTSPDVLGSTIINYCVPQFTKAELRTEGLRGEVLHVDDFGNVITNITWANLQKADAKPPQMISLNSNRKVYRMLFVEAYGDVSDKSALALIGSHGFLEFAVNQGNASRILKTKVGDAVTVSLQSAL